MGFPNPAARLDLVAASKNDLIVIMPHNGPQNQPNIV